MRGYFLVNLQNRSSGLFGDTTEHQAVAHVGPAGVMKQLYRRFVTKP